MRDERACLSFLLEMVRWFLVLRELLLGMHHPIIPPAVCHALIQADSEKDDPVKFFQMIAKELPMKRCALLGALCIMPVLTSPKGGARPFSPTQ